MNFEYFRQGVRLVLMTYWGLTHPGRKTGDAPTFVGSRHRGVWVVGLPRFELGQTEPKPVVLPLHHSPIQGFRRGVFLWIPHRVFLSIVAAKLGRSGGICKFFAAFFAAYFSSGLVEIAQENTMHGVGMQLRPCSAGRDEVVVLLASLHQQVAAVEQVAGFDGPVEGGDPLLVERHAAALYELAHLAP